MTRISLILIRHLCAGHLLFIQHLASTFYMPGTGLGARTSSERDRWSQCRADKINSQKMKQDAVRLGSLLQILSARKMVGMGCAPLKRVT